MMMMMMTMMMMKSAPWFRESSDSDCLRDYCNNGCSTVNNSLQAFKRTVTTVDLTEFFVFLILRRFKGSC